MKDSPPPNMHPIDVFKWSPSWGADADSFAYRSWDDPMVEVADLVQRGFHGRALAADYPITVVEHKRLAAQEHKDLGVYGSVLKFEAEEAERLARRRKRRKKKQ